jgi:two-component system, chemotaxis family, CheB/CheR fusion protein
MRAKEDLYIVGLGASAGGFDALIKFLKNLPEKTGAAYVIIQHLSPSYDSQIHKLLANYTKMPMVKVGGNIDPEPDHVYVIPENKILLMNQQGLYLKDRSASNVPNLVIDVFLETLADVKKEKAVGIILSGTGSDGARGVQAIKAAGGMVMVQSPQSASFDSMPNVSISSDHPDFIAPPEELAKELAHYLEVPDLLADKKLKLETIDEDETLKEIIHYISSFSGVNFRNYKPGTIIRRIEKRLKINHLQGLQEYVPFLQRHPKEVRHVFDDLLIGVTRFFRDKEAFVSLKENVIPKLCFERKSFDPIRIWVAGCSTGEEAYSIAILFQDYIQQNKLNTDFKIFATDVNQRAIDISSAGNYSTAIEEDVPKDMLFKYFNPTGEFYEVKKEIRSRIIFSKHNLLNDPPFIRMDLISCRNLFIYLNDETQNKVLHNFSYSLNPQGYLFLGTNESNNEQDKIYATVDNKNKIYQNKPNGTNRPFRPINYFFNDARYIQQTKPHIRHRQNFPVRSEEQYADLIVEKFAPPSMMVNHHEDVVYTTGDIDRFLQFPNRRTDLNLYNMVRGNMLLAFRKGLRSVREGKSKVVFTDIVIENHDEKLIVDLVFSRIDKFQRDSADYLVLVEFHEKGTQQNDDERAEVVTHDKYSQSEIENLEMELKLARRELRFTSDELETINEELQSSNEEMQSANEELQSTNEELQSSNEELQTVNNELKNKVDTITILHDDVLNLFHSTQIATIFLDSSLNIRKFTPPAKEYFNIRETDVGRPISHYSYNFNYHRIIKDIQVVLETLQTVEHEIEQEGKYSIMRILPYKTEALQVKGVVITFTDITEIKQKNIRLKEISDELRASEQHLKSLLDHTPDFIARFDPDLRFTFVNKALLRASKKELSDFLGKKNMGLGILSESERVHEKMKHVLETAKVVDYYLDRKIDNQKKYFFTKLVPELAEDGKKVESILYISTDITELKLAEQRLIENNMQLSEMYDRLDNFVHAIAHDLRAPIVNLKLMAEVFSKINPEERDKFINKIKNSVNKLDQTLKGLIQIIEVESEEHLAVETIDFKEVAEKVVAQFLDKIEKNHFHVEYDFSAYPKIRYIAPYIESILKNLIGNAIKYRSPDRDPELQLKTEQKNGFVVLSIRDNGLGIDLKKHKNELFKPFKRFHTHLEGVGVGLYTINYMISKKGGHIEVDSKPGEGSTFKIFLKPCDDE